MWVLFWSNQASADYENYFRMYELVSTTGKAYATSQFGLTALFKIFYSFGLSYNQTLAVLSFVGFVLIWSTVRAYSPKPQLVLLLYFIYPFLLNVVQIKQFLAMCLTIYGFKSLESEETTWKYMFCIVLASSIHMISAIFLPFLFIRKVKHEKLFQLLIIYLLISIPLAYTNFFRILATFIVSEARIGIYFDNRAKLGFFIMFIIQGFFLFSIYLSKNFLINKNENLRFVNLVYMLNLYILILFPLYVINMTFSRAFQMLLIPNYIVYSIVYKTMKSKGKPLLLIIFIGIAVLMFLYNIFFLNKESVLIPIFSENMVVNYFRG